MENFMNTGILNAKAGDFETSLEFFEQSIDIAKGLSDVGAESRACFHLGCLYNAMGEYAEGKAMHERAAQLVREEDSFSPECTLARDASSGDDDHQDDWA